MELTTEQIEEFHTRGVLIAKMPSPMRICSR